MLMLANTIKLAVASGCLVWVLWVLRRGQFSILETSWAVFCTSMGLVLLHEVFSDALGRYALLLGMAGGATCSVFYLYARALFRPAAQIGWPHLLLVGGIFLPSVINRALLFFGDPTWIASDGFNVLDNTLGSFQILLSSTALLLSFAEAGRGFAHTRGSERHMRLAFLGAFGICVTVCMVLPVRETFSANAEYLAQSVCALSIFAVSSVALVFRLQNPLTKTGERLLARQSEMTSDDVALGQRIEALFRDEGLHLNAELKVADIARHLMEPEYRISRAITAGLGEANFNRLANRYRIDHALALLADPDRSTAPILDIALDSGFASLGPFNRAFKTRTGLTPRQYRNQCVWNDKQAVSAE